MRNAMLHKHNTDTSHWLDLINNGSGYAMCVQVCILHYRIQAIPVTKALKGFIIKLITDK